MFGKTLDTTYDLKCSSTKKGTDVYINKHITKQDITTTKYTIEGSFMY